METNEALVAALGQVAEAELVQLVKKLNGLMEGDLKGLEKQVMETMFAVGRGCMECILSHHTQQTHPPSRRVGSCGHEQRLVGERPKQLLTVLGKVNFVVPTINVS